MATQSSAPASKRRPWFNYRWIVENIPFFLFLSLLAVLYIYNGHYTDKTVRSIAKLSRQVKEMNYEFKILKGEVIFRSKQSEVARAVAPLGLLELTTPPVVLQDSAQIHSSAGE